MQMEEAREIVDIASAFLSETIPIPRGNVRLEQIEEKPADWSVVLSYLDQAASANPLLQSLSTSRSTRSWL